MRRGSSSMAFHVSRSAVQDQSSVACFNPSGGEGHKVRRLKGSPSLHAAEKGGRFPMHEPGPSLPVVPGGPLLASVQSRRISDDRFPHRRGGPSTLVHGIVPFNLGRLMGNTTRFETGSWVVLPFLSRVRITTVHERSIHRATDTVHAGIGWRPPPPLRFRTSPGFATGSYADAHGFHHVVDPLFLPIRTDPTSDETSNARSQGRVRHLLRSNHHRAQGSVETNHRNGGERPKASNRHQTRDPDPPEYSQTHSLVDDGDTVRAQESNVHDAPVRG